MTVKGENLNLVLSFNMLQHIVLHYFAASNKVVCWSVIGQNIILSYNEINFVILFSR